MGCDKWLTVGEVSHLLGLSTRRIQAMVTEGWLTRDPQGRYPHDETIQGAINYYRGRGEGSNSRGGLLAEQERHERIKADRAALQLAREMDEQAPIADLAGAWVDTMAHVKTAVLELPDRLAPALFDAAMEAAADAGIGIPAIREALAEACTDALRILADSEIEGPPEPDTEAAPAASAAHLEDPPPTDVPPGG